METISGDDPECKCVTYVFSSNQDTKVRKVSSDTCDTLVNLEITLTDLVVFKKYCKAASIIQTKAPL